MDLMPLLAFPGGYGGMVHTSGDRVSLSCCLRRDVLARCRENHAGLSAGEAVGERILSACRGVREALAGASRDGDWLAAGPIRPGIRSGYSAGIFRVGNAAGEAHPVVAEGLSMALQGAALLAEELLALPAGRPRPEAVEAAGHAYGTRWKRTFGRRLRVASVVAHLAMSPLAARTLLPLLRCFPASLSLGARWSGKATPARRPMARSAD
jgi:flavin-dependent dehydrogenase